MTEQDFSDILLDKTTTQTQSAAPAVYAEPGTVLRAVIHTENWDADGESASLDCGTFEIDACDLSGPPNIFTIRAVSTPISSSLRREEKSKAWEGTTLREVAQDIALGADMELLCDVPDEILIDRADQLEQTDLSFLYELCGGYGVCLKVTDKQIVLFDEAEYERKPSALGFSPGDIRSGSNPQGRVIKYKFSQDTSDCVSSSSVSYKDSESGKLVGYKFEVPEAPATGQAIRDNTRPGNLSGDVYREVLEGGAGVYVQGSPSSGTGDTIDDFSDIRADVTTEAERRAKVNARAKNKREWTCELTLAGDTSMLAAATFEITGFGVYDGKYMVDEAAHKLGGGYETTVKAHRVLKGY